MKKVVIIGSGLWFPEESLSMMRAVAHVTVLSNDLETADVIAKIQDADTILVGAMPHVNRAFIESAPKLRHVLRVGVGVDSIDLQAATEHGIIVSNTPAVTVDAVSEFTLALLLGLAKNIPRCNSAVRTGNWNDRSKLARCNIELNGKTHGIVGLGQIGSRVAVKCKSFSMNVIYYKRNRDVKLEKRLGIRYVSFNELLEQSDSISLHIPLTKETTNLIDRPQFEIMKDAVLLINQSRGKVVNEKALLHALRERWIGGYATDVYEKEPPDVNSELFKFDNVIVSPHLGGATQESRLRACLAAAKDVVKVISDKIPDNIVNREVIEN